MAKILDWTSSEDTRDIVHVIVQALVEGQLVALPAETAYHVFATGLNLDAVKKLVALANEKRVRMPTVFLRSPQEALDYSPGMSPVAMRGVNRGWPGPLILELPIDAPGSLANQLPSGIKELLVTDSRFLSQRVAAHPVIREAMKLMPGPLVAASVVDGDSAVCEGPKVAQHVGDDVTFTVNDGATQYGGFASAVRVEGNQCTLRYDGVVEQPIVNELFQLAIMLVCTGNTCRSPMAEVILKDLITKRFPEWMDPQRPAAFVTSAGLSAFPGGPASHEAQIVMKQRGLDLRRHQSMPVTERSLRHADIVLTMTNSHRSAILEQAPELSHKIRLLSGSTDDVSDPFGGSESVYAACADQITEYLASWVEDLEESWFPNWQPQLS